MPVNNPKRLAAGTVAGAMLVALVGGFEGLRQTAYQDVGGVWTVCYGEAESVHPGDHYSAAQCKTKLAGSLQKYAKGISACVRVPMPDKRFIALTSFAYNVGIHTACHSSVVRLINEGRTVEGCNYLLHYNRAAGVVFPGLTRRRERERAYCLAN